MQPSGVPLTPAPASPTTVIIQYPQSVLDQFLPHHTFWDWLSSSAIATVISAVVAVIAILAALRTTRSQITTTQQNTRLQIEKDRERDFLNDRRKALIEADEARQGHYEAIRNLIEARGRAGNNPADPAYDLAYNTAESASRRAQYKLKLFGFDDDAVVEPYGNLRKSARALRDGGVTSKSSQEWREYRVGADAMNDALGWLTKNPDQDAPAAGSVATQQSPVSPQP
jgi:hypothetical protein